MKRLFFALAATGLLAANAWADTTPPSAVTPSIIVGKTTAVVNWTNSGDDGDTGCAVNYEVRRSGSPITNGNFSSATLIGSGTPGCAGSDGCADTSGLHRCTLYYFAVRLQDDAGNWSDVVSVSGVTNCSGAEVACP